MSVYTSILPERAQPGDPSATGGRFKINRFRATCLRELKKITRAWPDLHYHTVTGGLVLSPSPPASRRHSADS